MKNVKLKIYRSGKLICETEGVQGELLLHRLITADVTVDAPCGGEGRCGKCLVRLSPNGEQILSCRTEISGDMDIYLPCETDMQISTSGTAVSSNVRQDSDFPPCHKEAQTKVPVDASTSRLGVAVDIGTTTVVAHLINLENGVRIATASGANVQKTYGADVVSRIKYSIENGHEALTHAIRTQLKNLIKQACTAAGAFEHNIEYISIAANTTMAHLAAGYPPDGMGVVPFTPVSLFGEELPAWDNLPIAKGAAVYYAPALTAYVGGDITAGVLAAGLEDMKKSVIYLDIGTNGEIVLKHGSTYYCCATAAGPAFEGAEISNGMAAVRGAVDHVKWEGKLKLSVIGESAPVGLCGSGLLDALAVLLETGAVDETGRLLDSSEIEHEIASYVGKCNGKPAFYLTEDLADIYVTAEDIRKLQLAKSAIAAGIQTLLSHAGITDTQIDKLVLAGGFGSFMDKQSAARIGLFPESMLPVVQVMGNTAGEGAALALYSKTDREKLKHIRNCCEYVELSTHPVFNEQFIELMTF